MFGEDGAVILEPLSKTQACFQQHSCANPCANTALACVESVALQFSQATAVVLLLHKCLLLHV